MSDLRATKCDGCHKVATYDDDDSRNAVGDWAFIDSADSEKWRGVDLCPSCMARIMEGALR